MELAGGSGRRLWGKPGSLRRRLLEGYLWSIGGAVLAKAFMVFVGYYVARSLGQVGFGEFGVLQNTINTLGVLAGSGVGAAATKYIAQYRLADGAKAARIMSLNAVVAVGASVLLAALLFVYARELSLHVLNNPNLQPALKIGALSLFFSCLSGAAIGALAGFEKFRLISTLSILTSLLNGSLQCLLIVEFGLEGVVAAIVIAQAASALVALHYLRKTAAGFAMRFTWSGLGREVSTLYKFNLPSILGSIMVSPVNWIAAVLLVNQHNGYAEMGLFSAANQWKIALLFIPVSVSQVILSLLSHLQQERDRQAYRKVFFYNLYANLFGAALMFVLVLLFADFIMAAYGEGFEAGADVLIVMIAVAGLMAANNVVGQTITSRGKMWHGFGLNLIWGICLLLGAYQLCPAYGALGLALANLIAYTLHSLTQFAYVRMNLLREEG